MAITHPMEGQGPSVTLDAKGNPFQLFWRELGAGGHTVYGHRGCRVWGSDDTIIELPDGAVVVPVVGRVYV